MATPAPANNKTVYAVVPYMRRDERHKHEKPYYLYYQYDFDLPRTNTEVDRHKMAIHDARTLKGTPKDLFDAYGFTMLHCDCDMTQEDYQNSARTRAVLYPRFKELVKLLFPDAARVEVLEHGVRKRDPAWPRSHRHRHEYTTNQPSEYVHIDMTSRSAEKNTEKRLGISSSHYRRFVAINLWKPINGPITDWPLALCDRRTLNHAQQAVPMDIVTKEIVNENARIYHHEDHEWWYWSSLQNDEVLAFMQADSDNKDLAGVAHHAFQDTSAHATSQLRESIEARVYAYFD
ncbi:Oxidoreductase R2 [Pseudocercospora fuligena]|uniref:Oxidoreductase R2 n=1 Tax=Pseudocercospora fuligena TaxID=685502 RepID=A0A8H6VSM2_9PEZI|nr:Oxidoreductase R2 [Pseudocercospora fuligena]